MAETPSRKTIVIKSLLTTSVAVASIQPRRQRLAASQPPSAPAPAKTANVTSTRMQLAGWTWSGTLPWIKPASRPSKGGPKQDPEFILWGVKGSLDNTRDSYLPGHYIASQPRKDPVHIIQKPVEVMQQLVQVCPPAAPFPTRSPAPAPPALLP